MVIGMQLYTLREYCKTPSDIAKTLKKVSDIGYRVVQISGIGEIDLKELKKILDDNNLYACSFHAGYDDLIKNTEKIIENHLFLGAKIPVCPWLPIEPRNENGYKTACEEFNRIGGKMKKAGLTLAYHNHGIEFEKYGEKTGLEIIFSETKSENLSSEIDTYWVQYGGGDPAYWIEKIKRVPLIHFKDMGIKDNKQVMVPIGQGNLNWKAIIEACNKVGTKYAIVEMGDSPLYPIFENIKISFENMKSWGLESEIK